MSVSLLIEQPSDKSLVTDNMDQENEDPGVIGNEQEQLQIHHVAAVPMQELEGEIENLNNECVENQNNDEVQIIFEGPQQPRVAVVPPLGHQPEGPAPPAPAGLPVRDASEELRALERRVGVPYEDEGYASGGEDIDREPLDDRLREMESQILERPLVNLDFEMMEILHRQEAQRNGEPIPI
ncbi:hypothetical protein QAD02_004281 [Eretmocerus hayati]|uniref:Uncharacterized protein n=1 Tax=Eretmocerus hayati TaxID=131215 RepID=A0ACC2NTY5_9HYME|nr:hypothetical protein QAD02_004281 [Eretmocerus hayati]